VGGASTGAAVPPPDYFRVVREICDRHEVLFIADEVLCGAGRTGTWWAIEPFAAVPDLLTIGKGIAGGYAPLSALAAPRRIVDVLAAGSGSLRHAQTFSFHPVACAAGLAVVRALKTRRLVERVAEVGRRFHERLAGLARLPHVAAIRGRGLLAGVEFSDGPPVAEAFAQQALAEGLVVWPTPEFVMLAPPFIVSETELDEIATRFAAALDRTLAALPAAVS
jgi:adenosylmethionine-8-amino-7-oxononanoate aminotransferase